MGNVSQSFALPTEKRERVNSFELKLHYLRENVEGATAASGTERFDVRSYVGNEGKTGLVMLSVSFSQFDPTQTCGNVRPGRQFSPGCACRILSARCSG